MDYSKFYTPPQIAQALIDDLEILEPNEVVDICCGSCNLLYAAKKRWPGALLFGTDIVDQFRLDVLFEKKDGREFALENQGRFSLVVANPPFDYVGSKMQFPYLFSDEFASYSTSRLEIEMLIANLMLLKPGGVLLIIMPSSFVEAETHKRVRTILAKNYFVEKIIELDDDLFGPSKISSYALVVRKELPHGRSARIGVSLVRNEFVVSYQSTLSSGLLESGNWTEETGHQLSSINIKRGNVSSSAFVSRGQPVLHTARIAEKWEPSRRCLSQKCSPTVFAETGDIIVSRIGKSAGRWCVYNGERIPISDCLYRIKDPDDSIKKRIQGKLFDKQLKGVATKYITMIDFLSWYEQVSKNSFD